MYAKNLRLLMTMTLFEAKRLTTFPLEMVATVIGRTIEIGLFMTFWLLIGQLAGSGDVSSREVISYYLIISGITGFFFTELLLGTSLIRIIKTGELNQALIRPISPLLVPWSQRAGRNLLNYVIGAVQIIAGIIIAGDLTLSGSGLLPFIVLNTFVINLALNFIIGTMAFYVIEAQGLKNTLLHITRLGGGMLMPLFLMPASVATALQWTPFPAAQYHLAASLQGTYNIDPFFVFVGFMWAVALMVFALWFWRRSLGRYEAVGI